MCLAKETSQITRFYDSVDGFMIAFGFLYEQKRPNEKEGDYHMSFSNDHLKLESSNPTDTIKVATFLRNKKRKSNENIKKEHYYVCEFKWQPYRKIKEYKNSEEITYEGSEITETSHLLFRIFWEDDFNCWQRGDVFACRDASSHQEAADWMLKEITTRESEVPEHDSDYFKNGTLEVLK